MGKEDKLKDLSFQVHQIEVGARSGLDYMRTIMQQTGVIYQSGGKEMSYSQLKKRQNQAVTFLKHELETGGLNETFADDARRALDYYRKFVKPPFFSLYWLPAKIVEIFRL